MKILNIIIVVSLLLATAGCENDAAYSPKPKGYSRIVFPDKNYKAFTKNSHFTFDYPAYANIEEDADKGALSNWYNLSFPQFNGRLHLTYYPIGSIKDYDYMVEDARKLAFKHTVKANAIDQVRINYPENKVYGIYYEIEGNTASSVQFFLTDSIKNYFRGALYFNERPLYDSIEPVVKFIKKDIDRLIKSFKWKTMTSPKPQQK